MSSAIALPATAPAGTLRLVASVFKLRIAVAIMLSALAGLAVAGGEAPPAGAIAVLALAVLLSAAAAGAFNQFVERDVDRRMARTQGRPFATGRFRAGPAWLFAILGLLAVAVGLAGWTLNWVAALHVFLGAFVYGVVYTLWLKPRTIWNIVVGGLAGSFAVLAGAAAVDPAPNASAIILAVVLFLWTPPHFWSLSAALRDDYAKAGIPMLPVVLGERAASRIILAHTAVLVALSLLPFWFGMGPIYLAGAAVGGALFLAKSWRLAQAPGRKAAMANFFASLAQLCLLLAGAMADRLILG